MTGLAASIHRKRGFGTRAAGTWAGALMATMSPSTDLPDEFLVFLFTAEGVPKGNLAVFKLGITWKQAD